MLFRSNTEAEFEDPQNNLDKARLSRGYMGQSMIAKKKINKQGIFEQIDEEEDDDLIMHLSLSDQKQQ